MLSNENKKSLAESFVIEKEWNFRNGRWEIRAFFAYWYTVTSKEKIETITPEFIFSIKESFDKEKPKLLTSEDEKKWFDEIYPRVCEKYQNLSPDLEIIISPISLSGVYTNYFKHFVV